MMSPTGKKLSACRRHQKPVLRSIAVAFGRTSGRNRRRSYNRGEAVWIGATRDVPLGPAQELSWETSLKHIESPERVVFMARWLPPESIAPGYTLTTGDEITLVIREMNNELSRTIIKIRATRSGERVQDELLNRLERAHD